MTILWRLLALVTVYLAAGCDGAKPGGSGGSGELTGKLTNAQGQPVRNVSLYLQPTGEGPKVSFNVGQDGTFRGSVAPGEYTYYIAPLSGQSPGVPDKYLRPSPDRRITIGAGDSAWT